jgi:diacylglycerol kinase family enzyme
MAKISIYFNDASSRSKSDLWANAIATRLFRHNLNFKSPSSLEELKNELQQDVANSTEYIFSVGGDGTANTIIQNIKNENIKLLVIPTGTANDFATELGLSANINKILKVFQHKTSQKVDVIKVNEKYMVTNGGIGIAANVAEKINTNRKRIRGFKNFMKISGSKVYPMFFATEFITGLKTHRVHIESPHCPLMSKIVETPLLMINNQESIGGNFSIAPLTKNNDGMFNVTIFTHKNKINLMKASIAMMKGEYPQFDKELISFETDSLDLTLLDGPATFFGDGEVFEKSESFKISIYKQALDVCSYDKNLLYCNTYSLDNLELL